MQIYFAGAEVTSHLAIAPGMWCRACSGQHLQPVRSRSPSSTDGPPEDAWTGLEWVLYADSPHAARWPGAGSAARRRGAARDRHRPDRPGTRATWLANTDLLFLPIWDATDPTMLRDYTENYDGVTLPDAVVDNPVAVRQAGPRSTSSASLRRITGRSKGIERFDTLVSSAWWDVQKYGETQVWAANRLVRLNADDKRHQAGEVRPGDRGARVAMSPRSWRTTRTSRSVAPCSRGSPWNSISSVDVPLVAPV